MTRARPPFASEHMSNGLSCASVKTAAGHCGDPALSWAKSYPKTTLSSLVRLKCCPSVEPTPQAWSQPRIRVAGWCLFTFRPSRPSAAGLPLVLDRGLVTAVATSQQNQRHGAGRASLRKASLNQLWGSTDRLTNLHPSLLTSPGPIEE